MLATLRHTANSIPAYRAEQIRIELTYDGNHLASMMEQNAFTEWASIFAVVSKDKIIGFCTFLKTDYYPENRYSLWISSISVDESYRGNRISEKMIETVIVYAKEQSFSKHRPN